MTNAAHISSPHVALSFERDVRDEIVEWLQGNWSLLQDGGYPGIEDLSRKIRLLAENKLEPGKPPSPIRQIQNVKDSRER
jgi:hypothetical protein